MNKKIQEWNNLVIKGLVNGLSFTTMDERTEDIDFWIKRCNLFNEFSLCVLALETEQNYKYSENQLKEIAKQGYKLKPKEQTK